MRDGMSSVRRRRETADLSPQLGPGIRSHPAHPDDAAGGCDDARAPGRRRARREGRGPLDVAVIGGGQAGLAIGHLLAQQGRRLAIFEAGPAVGSAWRGRWDSLVLFTPRRYDALPGMPFPGDPGRPPAPGRGRRLPRGLRAPVRAARGDRPPRADAARPRGRRIRGRARSAATSRPPRWWWRPGRSRRRTRRRSPPASIPGSSRSTAPATAAPPTCPRGACWSSAAATPASRSRRTSPRPTGARSRSARVRRRCRSACWAATCSGGSPGPACSPRPSTPASGRRARGRDTLIGSSRRRLRRRGVTLHPRVVGASGRTVTLRRRGRRDAGRGRLGHGLPSRPLLDRPAGDGRRRPPAPPAGVTDVPGLYFLGLSWQHTRGSALLGFVEDDARFIAGRVDEHARASPDAGPRPAASHSEA